MRMRPSSRTGRLTNAIVAPVIVGLGLALVAATGRPAPGDDDVVKVSLKAYAITMPDTVPAGKPVFEITNAGTIEHGFSIAGANDALLARLAQNLAPGKSATLQVALEAGTYRAFCPVGDHKDRGMSREFTVVAGEPVIP